MMRQSDGEGIGSIELLTFEHVVGEMQLALDHLGYLLLGGVAIADNGDLDLGRWVFEDGDVTFDSGRHHHALCTTELDERVGIDAHEGRLDSKFVGVILVDELQGTFVDATQTHVVVLDLRQREHTHDDKRGLAVLDLQDRISHHVRSGVDAEDEFGFRHFSYCSKSSTPRIEGSKTRESSSIVCSY